MTYNQTGGLLKWEKKKEMLYTIQKDDANIGEVKIADEVVAIIAGLRSDGSRRCSFSWQAMQQEN